MSFLILGISISFSVCSPSDGKMELNAWCRHNSCSNFAAERYELLKPRLNDEDPYDAEAGTCKHLQYIRYREERVPTDQQESYLVVKYYSAGSLVGIREISTYLMDIGEAPYFIDYGDVYDGQCLKTEVLRKSRHYEINCH